MGRGLIEMRGLFDLAEMMVSVHLEEVECKVEKLITTSWRLYRRGLKKKKKIRTSRW